MLEAKLKLIHSPQHRALVGTRLSRCFRRGGSCSGNSAAFSPIGLEGFEGSIVDGLREKGAPNLELLPEGSGIVLVEFGADDPDASASTRRSN